MLCFFAAFAFLLLLKHGDVEINPGPKKKEARFFSCFHWNVNSILAHNKLSLLEAYNTVHKYDILCISETYLDSSVSLDDITLSLPVIILFNLIILAICLYYKENLSLISINVPFLSQCVLCEVTLQIRKGQVIVIYRSPSQSTVEFDEFLSNFENLFNFVKGLKPLYIKLPIDDWQALAANSCQWLPIIYQQITNAP